VGRSLSARAGRQQRARGHRPGRARRATCQQADRLSEGASAGRDPRAEAASTVPRTLPQRHRIGAAAHDDVIGALPTLRVSRGR
jgi:hypothetical protein